MGELTACRGLEAMGELIACRGLEAMGEGVLQVSYIELVILLYVGLDLNGRLLVQ